MRGSVKKKVAKLLDNFVSHRRMMRESPAWWALPDNARRVLDRLELEHMRHAGQDNGTLVCTYADFEAAGLRRASVALAIRQAVALGFLRIEREGFRSRAEFRAPSLYRLTYVIGAGRSPAPSDEWKAIETAEAADDALKVAFTQKAAAAPSERVKATARRA